MRRRCGGAEALRRSFGSAGSRVGFRFESCAVKWRKLQLPLPPVGSGWFDVTYLDNELRLCKDVRGDLQICTRRK